MKCLFTGVTAMAALSILATVSAAQAEVVTLPNGGVVDFQQNSGTGTFAGTLQQGGATSNFSCAYDAVSGQISGSSACGQILNGLNLQTLEQQIVSARVNVASNLQAMSNVQLLNDTFQRQIGGGFSVSARAAGIEADVSAGSAFGSSNLGSFGFAGGSFVDDNRAGFQKSGQNYIATVGLDHTGGNTSVGGHIGYQKTDLDLQSLDGELSSDGWVVGAYVTQVFSQRFSVTLSGTYSDSSVDLERTFTGTAVTAGYGHSELTGSVTASALVISTDSLALVALGGITYGAWDDDAYTDSRGIAFAKSGGDNTYAKFGGVLALMPSSALRPYGFATYNRLLSDPAFTGRDSLDVGGGLGFGSGRFTGGLEVGTQLFQEGQDNITIGLHLRFAV
jgi:hypothetical protein